MQPAAIEATVDARELGQRAQPIHAVGAEQVDPKVPKVPVAAQRHVLEDAEEELGLVVAERKRQYSQRTNTA